MSLPLSLVEQIHKAIADAHSALVALKAAKHADFQVYYEMLLAFQKENRGNLYGYGSGAGSGYLEDLYQRDCKQNEQAIQDYKDLPKKCREAKVLVFKLLEESTEEQQQFVSKAWLKRFYLS